MNKKQIVLPTTCIVIIALIGSKRKAKALAGIKSLYEDLKQNYSLRETNSFRYLDSYCLSFFDMIEVLPVASSTLAEGCDGSKCSVPEKKEIGFLLINNNDLKPLEQIENLKECEIILFTSYRHPNEIKVFLGEHPCVIDADNLNDLKSKILTR